MAVSTYQIDHDGRGQLAQFLKKLEDRIASLEKENKQLKQRV